MSRQVPSQPAWVQYRAAHAGAVLRTELEMRCWTNTGPKHYHIIDPRKPPPMQKVAARVTILGNNHRPVSASMGPLHAESASI